jgi:hypothetical protein
MGSVRNGCPQLSIGKGIKRRHSLLRLLLLEAAMARCAANACSPLSRREISRFWCGGDSGANRIEIHYLAVGTFFNVDNFIAIIKRNFINYFNNLILISVSHPP